MPAMWGGIAAGVGALGGAFLSARGAADVNQASIGASQQAMQDQFIYNNVARNEANAFSAQQAATQRDWAGEQTALARDFNLNEATKNRGFQEWMSNTSYQRAVTDLKLAGLNPMLAYGQGGASSPAGSMATSPVGSSGAAGSASSSVGLSVPHLENRWGLAAGSAANAARAVSEVALLGAQKQFVQAKTQEAESSAGSLDTNTARVKQEMQGWNARLTKLQSEAGMSLMELWDQEQRYNWQRGQGFKYGERLESKYSAELQSLVADAARLSHQAELYRLEIPKSMNEAAQQSSLWMRYVSPYMPDIVKGATAGKLLK